jgi:hypothetical protein
MGFDYVESRPIGTFITTAKKHVITGWEKEKKK